MSMKEAIVLLDTNFFTEVPYKSTSERRRHGKIILLYLPVVINYGVSNITFFWNWSYDSSWMLQKSFTTLSSVLLIQIKSVSLIFTPCIGYETQRKFIIIHKFIWKNSDAWCYVLSKWSFWTVPIISSFRVVFIL